MADTCPTCGCPVEVVSGGEGTNHYQPLRQSFYIAGYERAEAKQAARVAELEAAVDAALPLYHAANCLVGQADSDSIAATVLTPALVAYEQAVTKGESAT